MSTPETGVPVKENAEEEIPAKSESGPDEKETKEIPGGKVETPSNGAQPKDDGDDENLDGVNKTITQLRADRRRARQRIAELEEQLKSRTDSPRTKSSEEGRGGEHTEPSFFEDPEFHLKRRDEQLAREILGNLRIASEKQQALKLIRSQEGFTSEDEDALADLMEEKGLSELAKTRPLQAAELAVLLWQKEKGLAPSRTAGKARAASVRGGAPAVGPKKTTLSSIRSLTERMQRGENVRKELDEAWAAAKEGRIIED